MKTVKTLICCVTSALDLHCLPMPVVREGLHYFDNETKAMAHGKYVNLYTDNRRYKSSYRTTVDPAIYIWSDRLEHVGKEIAY